MRGRTPNPPSMDGGRHSQKSSRLGLFGLGLLVGALFGYWLFDFIEQTGQFEFPFRFDGYVWLAALLIGLVVVFRPRRG